MKNVLFVISFFSFPLFINGQTTFAPEGAKWHYGSFFGWVGAGITSIEAAGDTLVDGTDYRMLKMHVANSQANFEHTLLIRQSADSIFYNFGDTEYYLFKQDMLVGESYQFDFLGSGNSIYTVLSLDTLQFSGEPVRRYKMSYNDLTANQELYIYDKFGPEHGFWEQWLTSPADGNDHFFRCYEDDDIALINLSNVDCLDGAPTPVDETMQQFLHCYPNPVSETLFIDWPFSNTPPDAITVFNQLGQSFDLSISDLSINTYQVPSGLYVGEINVQDHSYFIKFQKQ